MGYSADTIMHLALGTSLATIVVTSISSLMAHHKMWPVFINLASGMASGCFVGAGFGGWLSGVYLQLIVGIFLLWVAFTMLTGGKKLIDANKVLSSNPKLLTLN